MAHTSNSSAAGQPGAWNLDETRQRVAYLFGDGQLDLAGPCIRSVDDRQTYARIHYEDWRSTLEKYVLDTEQDGSLLHAMLGVDDDEWIEFNWFMRRVGAYVTACVQSMHSIADIFANAIFYSLGLNLVKTPLASRKVNAASVIQELRRLPLAEGARLGSLIKELAQGGSFPHLSALANRAKHRSIVLPSFSEDWTGQRPERHLIMLESFEHDGKILPQVDAASFLSDEYSRCSRLVVDIGTELNSVLRARTPAFVPVTEGRPLRRRSSENPSK